MAAAAAATAAIIIILPRPNVLTKDEAKRGSASYYLVSVFSSFRFMSKIS